MRKAHTGQRPPRRQGEGHPRKPGQASLRGPKKNGVRPSKPGPGKRAPAKASRSEGPRTPRSAKPPRREGGSSRTVAAVAEPMRIAKAMARAGLCSRREAERWIADGRVSVNGQVLKTPACEVAPKDKVLVDGRPLPLTEPTRLWRYYKPKGLVTTHVDPQGRPTVFENLPAGLPRVVSIGRLDFNTEGLLLLTNDGELARHLELPGTGWLRRYRVRARGRTTQADLDRLKEGVEIEGVRYGPIEGAIDSLQGANVWLTLGIREGKNREIRKVLASLGLEVNRLIRISFGPFQISELKPGEAESVKRRVLADQMGPQLAAKFGLAEAPEKASPEKDGRAKRSGARKGKPKRETS
jgi:23S rRNA pseudouridine2605 synthase